MQISVTCMAVVLIMKSNMGISYSYGDLQQIFWGFENLNLCTPMFSADIRAQLRHVGPGAEIVVNCG